MSEQTARITMEDALTEYHNKHLRMYASACIDGKIYEKLCADNPDQTVAHEQGHDGSGTPVNIPVSAKKALERSQETAKNQKRILDTIKELDKEKQEV